MALRLASLGDSRAAAMTWNHAHWGASSSRVTLKGQEEREATAAGDWGKRPVGEQPVLKMKPLGIQKQNAQPMELVPSAQSQGDQALAGTLSCLMD